MKHMSKLAAVSAGVLTLAGCGSSSSSGTSPASAANFVAQGNQICAGINRQEAAMPAITTTAELVKEAPKQLSLVSSAVGRLKALTPPAGKQALFGQWIAGLADETAADKQIVAAIKANDAASTKVDAARLGKLSSAGHARATSLGLTQCAKKVHAGSGSKGSG